MNTNTARLLCIQTSYFVYSFRFLYIKICSYVYTDPMYSQVSMCTDMFLCIQLGSQVYSQISSYTAGLLCIQMGYFVYSFRFICIKICSYVYRYVRSYVPMFLVPMYTNRFLCIQLGFYQYSLKVPLYTDWLLCIFIQIRCIYTNRFLCIQSFQIQMVSIYTARFLRVQPGFFLYIWVPMYSARFLCVRSVQYYKIYLHNNRLRILLRIIFLTLDCKTFKKSVYSEPRRGLENTRKYCPRLRRRRESSFSVLLRV